MTDSLSTPNFIVLLARQIGAEVTRVVYLRTMISLSHLYTHILVQNSLLTAQFLAHISVLGLQGKTTIHLILLLNGLSPPVISSRNAGSGSYSMT